jgi:glycosyltransferase involved in cell wall biosynthesis
MRASVLVCTRDRAEVLRETLGTILADRSTVPREVVVVDNGSTDGTADVVRSFGVRYVHEPQVGIANARNRAVEEARGDLLLFADDDVRVCDGWADALAAAFDDPDVAVVAGRIVPDWPTEPPRWLQGPHADMLTSVDFGPESRHFGPDEHPTSGNLGLRAGLVRRFDPPFEPRLGHAGSRRIGHEETHLVNRLRELGAVVYRPDALVRHRIDARRIDLDWMRAAFFELGVGLGRRGWLEGFEPPSLPRRVVRALRTYRVAQRHTRTNERVDRQGPETWDELYAYMWAGLHVELLVGRIPRVGDWVVRALA